MLVPTLVFIIIIIVAIYAFVQYSRYKWNVTYTINKKLETTKGDESNIRFHMNKYIREIKRAKEIIHLGLLAFDKERKSGKNVYNDSNIIPVMANYNYYNIYSLLGDVLKTVSRAEDDLLYRIERSNAKISDFNSYIQAPFMQKMVASNMKLQNKEYNYYELQELGRLLDVKIADVKLLEANLSKISKEEVGSR